MNDDDLSTLTRVCHSKIKKQTETGNEVSGKIDVSRAEEKLCAPTTGG